MERYWVTGAQLGIFKVALETNLSVNRAKEILKKIMDNQFIGRMPDYDYDKCEIVIREKEVKE